MLCSGCGDGHRPGPSLGPRWVRGRMLPSAFVQWVPRDQCAFQAAQVQWTQGIQRMGTEARGGEAALQEEAEAAWSWGAEQGSPTPKLRCAPHTHLPTTVAVACRRVGVAPCGASHSVAGARPSVSARALAHDSLTSAVPPSGWAVVCPSTLTAGASAAPRSC